MQSTNLDDVGKLVLRLVLGILILLHGIGKIPSGAAGIVESAGIIGYGVFLGEVLGPALLIIGWYARIGAALVVVNMLFAIGMAHADQIFMLNQHGGWQIELQGMFLFTALALALTGPGKFSINQK